MRQINNMLVKFATVGNLDVVKKIVEQRADILALNWALMNASGHGHLDVVKYLIEAGANVNSNSHAALRFAYDNRHLDVFEYLTGIK